MEKNQKKKIWNGKSVAAAGAATFINAVVEINRCIWY